MGPAVGALLQLPQPMLPDCKIVRGKVPGPANHVLCAKHGHVVDTATKMVIAWSVDDYKKMSATLHKAAEAAAPIVEPIAKAAGALKDEVASLVGNTADPWADPPKDQAAGGKLPQPMLPDCKIVHGKVRGPANHLLCAKHGHVIDTTAKMIIAHSIDEYEKMRAALEKAADLAAPVVGAAVKAAGALRDAAATLTGQGHEPHEPTIAEVTQRSRPSGDL